MIGHLFKHTALVLAFPDRRRPFQRFQFVAQIGGPFEILFHDRPLKLIVQPFLLLDGSPLVRQQRRQFAPVKRGTMYFPQEPLELFPERPVTLAATEPALPGEFLEG
jgi:hypothetical protein